jgi:hypothetical protein
MTRITSRPAVIQHLYCPRAKAKRPRQVGHQVRVKLVLQGTRFRRQAWPASVAADSVFAAKV